MEVKEQVEMIVAKTTLKKIPDKCPLLKLEEK